MFAGGGKQQSVERVDYNGSRSYMTSYIQAKYSETEGVFTLDSAVTLKRFGVERPRLFVVILSYFRAVYCRQSPQFC